MLVPIVVLMAGGLAVGILPGCRTAADRAAAFFLDGPGYAAQALYRHHVVTVSTAASNWTGVGIGLGFVSVAAAAAIATAGLYGRSLSERWPQVKRFAGPVALLHRLHSGHIGDYVAWLMMGMAILAGFIGFPLR
jgi:multicomponent Na+:H+ antiporter subunit D